MDQKEQQSWPIFRNRRTKRRFRAGSLKKLTQAGASLIFLSHLKIQVLKNSRLHGRRGYVDGTSQLVDVSLDEEASYFVPLEVPSSIKICVII